MKKFIISFICALLLSCNPFTNPAYAYVVEQDSIIFPVSSEKQEYSLCLDIADFSFTAMLAHQNGVSEEAQLSLAPVQSHPKLLLTVLPLVLLVQELKII